MSRCFIILTLCFNVLTLTLNDGEQIDHYLSEACPYTDFCSTYAREIKPHNTSLEPCCSPCFCDDDCWELDNCCPDKELTEPRPQIVPCIDSYVKPRNFRRNPYVGFYRVIDSCPRSKDSSNLVPKCSSDNKTSLEDFLWVSDKTGRIYKNIYCAECHGIKETIPWQIKTTSYDIMKTNFVNLMDTLQSVGSDTIFAAPEELKPIVARYKCYNPSIFLYSSCNETGTMTQLNPDLKTACEQSTWPFLIGLQAVRNIFCVMCNQDRSTVPNNTLCIPKVLKEPDTGFTFFIDYRSSSIDTTEKENKCGLEEMFDEFMGLCRKLLCPIGTAPLHGRCKQLVSTINGFVVSVQFYLDIIWNQTSLVLDYKNETIWNVTYARFLELAGLYTNCEVCRKMIERVEGRNSTSNLILVVILHLNSQCDYGLALAKLADMRDKLIEIYFNRTSFLTLLVRSDKQPATIINQQSFETIYHYSANETCTATETLSFDDIACPRVQLDYTELELISQTDNKGKDVFASFFIGRGEEQNVTSVFICLDKYISVMSQFNQAPLADSNFTVRMLPVLLLNIYIFSAKLSVNPFK